MEELEAKAKRDNVPVYKILDEIVKKELENLEKPKK